MTRPRPAYRALLSISLVLLGSPASDTDDVKDLLGFALDGELEEVQRL